MAGRILIWFLLLTTLVLTVPAVSPFGATNWVSLACSSVAFVAMSLNQFLATRPRYLERFFDGLDRIYVLHRQLGMLALGLILVHYFVEPNFKGLVLTSGLNELAADAGEVAFLGFVILIAFSLIKRIPLLNIEIPYHLWRQSHRLMGVLFMFAVFHQMFIKRPFDGSAVLSAYLNMFAVVGVVSFAWTQLAPFFRKRRYNVVAVEREHAATVLTLSPKGRPLKSSPGQFAFLNFDRSGLSEPHPFTIAGKQANGDLTFAIKPAGDFTQTLRKSVQVGDPASVQGAYGRFRHEPKPERQIWLAGGIGITPFLAMAEALEPGQGNSICLVHCVRSPAQAVGENLLCEKARSVTGFEYILYASEEHGRLTVGKLAEIAGFEIDGSLLCFCGPQSLRESITDGMKSNGKRFAGVRFEKFEFR